LKSLSFDCLFYLEDPQILSLALWLQEKSCTLTQMIFPPLKTTSEGMRALGEAFRVNHNLAPLRFQPYENWKPFQLMAFLEGVQGADRVKSFSLKGDSDFLIKIKKWLKKITNLSKWECFYKERTLHILLPVGWVFKESDLFLPKDNFRVFIKPIRKKERGAPPSKRRLVEESASSD
ncbi:MAG: hypothetical protein MUF12_06520, partial [Sediminibacterium sp.]|nr:hypothetical protein [Sediminibacterium sp.]